MKREQSKNRGKAGKSLEATIDSGRNKIPAKMFKYHRKNLRSGKKGRRAYPWRKKKHLNKRSTN